MTQSQTKTPLGICDTVLRDSHQSLLATRMRTEDMIPAMEMLDDVGYWSLEVWGGATFDACMRFLNEDPWERLRVMRKRMPKTRLQMLLRGQNVVGYRHYADDVVERFVARAVENGMQVFRIFDAFNDIRNMEAAMRAVKKYGGHLQASVCYTLSPVHSNEGFVKTFTELLQYGADSLCIKDMGGLISPTDAADLVGRLKAVTAVPISLHSHYTSGMASMAYFKAAEAGVDIVDCAISSMSLGTSQPPTESVVAAMAGTPRATGIGPRPSCRPSGSTSPSVRKGYAHLEMRTYGVDTNVLQFQVPGGMISNLVNQLREQNQEDKLPEVLKEIPRVRADLGLSTAGHTFQPDLRIAGGPERAHGRALQDGAEGSPEHREGDVRSHPRPHRCRLSRSRSWATRPPSPAALPTCWSRRWRRPRPRSARWPRTRRTCSPTSCSRRWPRSSSPAAASRPPASAGTNWPRSPSPWARSNLNDIPQRTREE